MENIDLYEGSNPVIPVGTGEETDLFIREPGNVLYEPADTGAEYKTWYTGYTDETDHKIHYAYSSDGKVWTKAGVVISTAGIEDPYVVKSGSTYYLFVESGSAIRRYHSDNLTDWTDDGNVTGIGSCQSPTVWIEDATWYMLYENMTAPISIHLATSSDGLAWTNSESNPVFVIADAPWATGPDLVPDDIMKIDTTYYMTYHALASTISPTGIATSTNLTDWTEGSNNPITPVEGLLTSIPSAQVFNDGSEIVFLYWARDAGNDDTLGLYRGYPIKAVSG